MAKQNIIVFECNEQEIDSEGLFQETGKKREYCVRRPNAKQQREGQKVYNRAFQESLGSGCILRVKLEDFMREQKIWDDVKQQRLIELNKKINNGERRLRGGGFDLDEAAKLAKEMRGYRGQLRDLVSDRTELDVNTAEGQADNQRFNYLLSACLVYNDTQQPVFSSVDDYIEKAGTEQASMGAQKFAQLWYDLDEDYEAKYEEIKFLRDYGFMNENNHFINEDGKLVDGEGRLVDEEGNYILPDGTRCDIDGNPLDKDGNYIVEKKPFTKKGKPVQPKKEKPTKKVEEAPTEAVATTE